MSIIVDINARQILDSRGNPTVEVEVITENDIIGRAAVPSGASTGKYEAVELRDGDPAYYMGKSVMKAVKAAEELIYNELDGMSVFDQAGIDYLMLDIDGSENKSVLGANAILGVSMAVAKAAALETKQSLYRYLGGVNATTLPIPLMNILNGGAHADNNIDIQEFMVVPVNATYFSEALHMGTRIFHTLKKVLQKEGYSTNVGDEGGFAPNLKSNEEGIKMVIRAIEEAGYRPGFDVMIALDAAASEFYDSKEKVYHLQSTGDKLSSDEMVAYWVDWCSKYPIVSIEDGMDEDDWTGWAKMTEQLGSKVQLVGDDLFVTNVQKLEKGINEKVANAILVKVNQIGSLTETFETVRLANANLYNSVISHRSGETEDTTIADISVALNTGQIKTGSLSRTDRICKYNQLLRIEEELGDMAFYPGATYRFF